MRKKKKQMLNNYPLNQSQSKKINDNHLFIYLESQ